MLLEHCLVESFLRGVEHGREINAHGFFKLFVGAFRYVKILAGVGFAEVVDKNVETAFFGKALVYHASVRCRLVCLKVYELGLAAACACGFDCGFAGLHISAGVIYLCALIDK